MSKQVPKKNNLENNQEEVSSQESQDFVSDDSIDQVFNDVQNLKQLIDANQKAAILCKVKEKNPNYLSIVHANAKFYENFGVTESNLIGKNYDFLFDDIDVGYASDNQLEYVRLVKDVKEGRQCSIIVDVNNLKPDSARVKFKVDFNPIENNKNYSIFLFEELESFVIKKDAVVENNHRDVGFLKNLERALHNER
ncbi:MAG: hypothetical protein KGQ36_07490, partial [Rickettsiales bacterium]|nr:hypothetical protein [Rickettsiales bacterium]